MATKANLPSAVEDLVKRGERGKVTESSHRLDVDTNVDIPAEERRTLKIRITANRLEMNVPPLRPQDKLPVEAIITYMRVISRKTSTSSKVPFDGILEEFVSQMTTVLSNIIEQHHARKNQRLASLKSDYSCKTRGGEAEGHDSRL
ncbi:hypothetical protein R1flu_013174 [Riccia fluitans]|uniref:Uncharacterized protein n=1 Tax=Riccia fluitans TaxID=41844 RepID=A0ABD1XED0_9MARC